jgi:hypothetical protein
MNSFAKKFTILLEQPELPGEAIPSEADDELGIEDENPLGLDQGTPGDAFDDVPENPAVALRQQQYGQTMDTLRAWVEQVEGWVDTLNGLDGDSMNAQLNKADCDSIMADVGRSESKKISRLAQDLSSLSESLKQYLLSAEQKANSRDTI